jgi:hypothetical protein
MAAGCCVVGSSAALSSRTKWFANGIRVKFFYWINLLLAFVGLLASSSDDIGLFIVTAVPFVVMSGIAPMWWLPGSKQTRPER